MEKEIFSSNDVLSAIEEKYIKNGLIYFDGIDYNFNSIKFIASGSSYNAARLAHKFFEYYTSKSASFEYASEFISNPSRRIKKDTLYCFVSQSGETYDTKCALDIVKKEKGKTLAVVNNSNSTIYNLCDYKIDMLAGDEFSIAATKSFLSGVICLWLLALAFSDIEISPKVQMNELKLAVANTLLNSNCVDDAAKFLAKKRKISIIGYDWGYILAKELALKIKETSFIDTTAYPTGEFLHGHTAILNKNKTLIEIFTRNMSAFEKNTLLKIKKDFNPSIVSVTDDDISLKNTIHFAEYEYDISKIASIIIILQLLSLKIATVLGMDVDKPKGLNKVVSA